MKIKLRLQSMDEWEISLYEHDCTLPIVRNKTMMFGAYNVDFVMTDNIWYQLPEEYKRKIYNNHWKRNIKNMLITITDITAYSFSFAFHDKLKDEITMEEFYENFDKTKKIECFITNCEFPHSPMGIYFQYLGEIYIEIDLDDLIAYSEEENSTKLIIDKMIRDSEYRKEREKNVGRLEEMYIKQNNSKSKFQKIIEKIAKREEE